MWDINGTLAVINTIQGILVIASTFVAIACCYKYVAKKEYKLRVLVFAACLVANGVCFGAPALRDACIQAAKSSVYMEGEDVRAYPVSESKNCLVNGQKATLSSMLETTGVIKLTPYEYYFDMSDLGNGRICIYANTCAIFGSKCIYSDGDGEPRLWTHVMKSGDRIEVIDSTDTPRIEYHQVRAYYIEPLTQASNLIDASAPKKLQDCLPDPSYTFYIPEREVPDWLKTSAGGYPV